MMTTPRMAFTSLALTALLVPGVALAGGSLTKADFERCNQQAMQVAGIADSQSPAASPGLSGSGAGTSGSMGTASPSSPGASTSGGAVGSSGTMSSPSASGSATGGSTSTGASTGAAGSSVAGSGTHSGTGSTAATGGADHEKLDRAVQAYRACLQQ
jgi:hypothetical protein